MEGRLRRSVLLPYQDTEYNVKEYLPPIPRRDATSNKNAMRMDIFLQLLSKWDKGNKATRERIIEEFVLKNEHKTGPQLERDFGNGASLFLTRLTAWLRLTYLLGYNLQLQLKAIIIFISAASGHRFLSEFMEVGGVLTVLEILSLSHVKEREKAEALKLLSVVASSGRKHKEFICESFGVRAVADCLSKAKSEVTLDYARNLLHQLGLGNPKYLNQVYKTLLSLLTGLNPTASAQQLAGQALRQLLPSIREVHPSIVEATISLLKSVHVQVQYEGYELIIQLLQRGNLQDIILTQLIAVLRNVEIRDEKKEAGKGGGRKSYPNSADKKNQWEKEEEGDKDAQDANLPTYIQQAHAAKLLGVAAVMSENLASRMIELEVVGGLLTLVGNSFHPESQKYAANTLSYLCETFPVVLDALREQMGPTFVDLLQTKADTFYRDLTREQKRNLRSNHVRIFRQDYNDGIGPGNPLFEESTPIKEATEESEEETEQEEKEAGETTKDEMEAKNNANVDKTDAKAQEEEDIYVIETGPERKIGDIYLPFSIPFVKNSLSGNKFSVTTQIHAQEKFNVSSSKKFREIVKNERKGVEVLDEDAEKKIVTVEAMTKAKDPQLFQVDMTMAIQKVNQIAHISQAEDEEYQKIIKQEKALKKANKSGLEVEEVPIVIVDSDQLPNPREREVNPDNANKGTEMDDDPVFIEEAS